MLSSINFKTVSREKRNSEPFLCLSLSKRLFPTLAFFLFAAVTSVAQSNISVSVSPKNGGLAVGQTLSLVATVSNDSSNQGVTWSASGSGCSGVTCGTFSSATSASGVSDTYTAPSTAGIYTITATSVADITASFGITIGVTDLAGVFTYHNDLSRDGTNPSEYTLTPSNVDTTTFGKLFSCTVDGAIYAQPLWVANLTISSAKHNVVFVATQHESLYAFDADINTTPCTPLWHVSLIDSAHGGSTSETSVPSGPTGYLVGKGYGDITPEVGITGTPVIDPSTNTLYVVSKSVIASGPTFFQRLHGIDITTGKEKFGGPVTIAGTYPGTGDGSTADSFNARQQNQRAGLALVNGIVYIAWAAHEDTAPYYGWVIGYNASNLTPAAVLNISPNAGYGGIWMSGGAPSADANNNVYLITGNGTFDATNGSAPNNDYGDSFLQLTGNLQVSSYFTPTDEASDASGDADFGAGGAAVVLNVTSGTLKHLVIGGGKDESLYLLNGDSMGGLGDSNARQKFTLGYAIFATGAFWNNNFYIAGKNGPLICFSFDSSTNLFNTSIASRSSSTYGFPGATPSVSSMGSTNGIVWALDNSNYCTKQSPGCGPAVLHAYDSTNLATELWNSSLGTGNAAGNAVKFTVPTIANGKVYVGTRGNNTGGSTSSSTIPGELDVFGLLSVETQTQAAPPTISPGTETFTGSVSVSISDATSGAVIYYTTDNSTPSPGVGTTTVYGGSFNVTATTTVKAIATASGYANSAVTSATYTLQTGGGTGPSIRVRAGTATSYTDPSGNVWTGDVDYVGGTEAALITHAISNTTTQPLYQSERYNGFTYTFTGLAAGSSYAVTLKFSENYWTVAGKRKFNVIVNGTTVLTNFDIFADAGGQYIADDKTFSTTVNSLGQIVIQFQNGSADYAKIDAIQLAPSGMPTSSSPQISPGTETFTGSVSVSISDATSGAVIYYTTDNSTPSPGVGTTTVYGGSFNVTATTTVKAIATASGYANSAVTSATYTLQTGGGTGPSIRVRAGTATSYTDPSGNVWTGDVDYVGGTEAALITHAISNTTTQPLYQSERYNGFTYTFTGLAAGSSYAVTLKFSENYWTVAGKRKFNVIVNGTTVLTNFDIFADAGGQYIADDKTFSTTVNSLGQIVIQFQNGSADYAKIDAIQLAPSGMPTSSSPQISPGTETFTGSVSVSISDATSGAVIYYTTDNSTPSPGVGTTTVYGGSFNVTATTTVKAIATASGYANSAVTSATYTLQTGGGTGPSIRVRAGTATSYTDPSGNVWTGDVDYVGGTEAALITHAISNTTTQPLYQSERYNGFTYTFTGLAAGSSYAVTLKFSENYWTVAGKRKFNVIVNGTTVLTNFDIFADAGGQYIADDKTFSTTVNSLGQIVIQFQNGSADYAKIDAIQLVP